MLRYCATAAGLGAGWFVVLLIPGMTRGRTLVFGGLANLHDTLSLYVMGLMAVTLACFVVVPYGLFCQYVMNPLANSSGTGLRSS